MSSSGISFYIKRKCKKILRSGLRIKSGEHRDYPQRIYLWAIETKTLNKKKAFEFAKQVVHTQGLTINNFMEYVSIIKVDLSNTNFHVYKDTMMEEKEAIFIYNRISAKLCKEIKIYKK